MSPLSPATMYRTSEPARSLVPRAAVVDSRPGSRVPAGAAAGRLGALAAVRDSARPMARAASTVPRPAPGAAVRPAVVPLISTWLT
jgi:hypothetical protein